MAAQNNDHDVGALTTMVNESGETPKPVKGRKTKETAVSKGAAQNRQNKREAKTLIDVPLPSMGESLSAEPETGVPTANLKSAAGAIFSAKSETSIPSANQTPFSGERLSTPETDASISSQESQSTNGIQHILNSRAKSSAREEKRKRTEAKTMIDQPIPIVDRISEEPLEPKGVNESQALSSPSEPLAPASQSLGTQESLDAIATAPADLPKALRTGADSVLDDQTSEVRPRQPSRTMIDYSALDLIGQPLTKEDPDVSLHPISETGDSGQGGGNLNGNQKNISEKINSRHELPAAAAEISADLYSLTGSSFATEKNDSIEQSTKQLAPEATPGSAYSWIPQDVQDESASGVSCLDSAPHEVRPQGASRTMLDHEMIWETVEKNVAKEELRVAQEIKEKLAQPAKEQKPIVDFKLASNCPFNWSDTDSKDRVRFCSKCQMQIYNFAGMELPEAEALIFQRENRKEPDLFKRADGKFMTADCPVAMKRRQDFFTLLVGGSILAACAVALMLMLPHLFPTPTPKPAVVSDSKDHPPPKRKRKYPPAGASASTGASANRPGTVPPTAPQPASDDGQYWQFPDGQGQYSTIPTIDSQSQAPPPTQPPPPSLNQSPPSTPR
jgi:hypothetical protein